MAGASTLCIREMVTMIMCVLTGRRIEEFPIAFLLLPHLLTGLDEVRRGEGPRRSEFKIILLLSLVCGRPIAIAHGKNDRRDNDRSSCRLAKSRTFFGVPIYCERI